MMKKKLGRKSINSWPNIGKLPTIPFKYKDFLNDADLDARDSEEEHEKQEKDNKLKKESRLKELKDSIKSALDESNKRLEKITDDISDQLKLMVSDIKDARTNDHKNYKRHSETIAQIETWINEIQGKINNAKAPDIKIEDGDDISTLEGKLNDIETIKKDLGKIIKNYNFVKQKYDEIFSNEKK